MWGHTKSYTKILIQKLSGIPLKNFDGIPHFINRYTYILFNEKGSCLTHLYFDY